MRILGDVPHCSKQRPTRVAARFPRNPSDLILANRGRAFGNGEVHVSLLQNTCTAGRTWRWWRTGANRTLREKRLITSVNPPVKFATAVSRFYLNSRERGFIWIRECKQVLFEFGETWRRRTGSWDHLRRDIRDGKLRAWGVNRVYRDNSTERMRLEWSWYTAIVSEMFPLKAADTHRYLHLYVRSVAELFSLSFENFQRVQRRSLETLIIPVDIVVGSFWRIILRGALIGKDNSSFGCVGWIPGV